MDRMKDNSNITSQGKRELRLLEGRLKFISELSTRLDLLQQLLEDEGACRETAAALYRILHTIKGSAPLFELEELAAVALRGLPEWEWSSDPDGTEPPYVDQDKILSLCAEIRRIMGANQPTSVPKPTVIERFVKEEFRPRSKGHRILVIDDEPSLRSFLLQRLIEQGYEADEADGVQSAVSLLRRNKYDLLLLDLVMAPRSGYELFELLKEDPTWKWIPLIVLSGKQEVEDKVRCFRMGADDYVVKPFIYEELEARIDNIIRRNRSFEQLAFQDPLTGVNNRRYFDHQLEIELQRVKRYPSPLSIVFIDIDRFKSINDTYGHGVGDKVLQGLAAVLQQQLRASDLLARYGGEEFVVVMPNTGGEQAQQAVRGVLERIRAMPVANHEGQGLNITFSAGISEWRPGMLREDWIRAADQAMYRAKELGRNRVEREDYRIAADKPAEAVQRYKKLLLADEDLVLRSLLVDKLRFDPVEVLEAGDGVAAARIIQEHRPDVAVLDGYMPFPISLDKLRDSAARDGLIAMKVLVLSERGEGRSRLEPELRQGADEYMAKPYSVPELEQRIREMLGLLS